jgi:hypothetical protein
MRRTFYLSVLLVLTSQVAHAQQHKPCVGDGVVFANNQDVPMTLSVQSGQTCVRMIRRASIDVKSIQFVQQPKHGALRRVGRLGYTYTARKGYVGADSYVVRYVGTSADRQGNTAFQVYQGVAVTMNVTP